MLDWYAPRPRKLQRPVVVVDPFAGGVVRGFVAAAMGFVYVGVDVSQRQVHANQRQVPVGKYDFQHQPTWLIGDGEDVERLVSSELQRRGLEPYADVVVSCPPYFNLEEYNAGPNDLSMLDSYVSMPGLEPSTSHPRTPC